jgi:proline racemase
MMEISSKYLKNYLKKKKLEGSSIITTIDSHTAGDPTRMVVKTLKIPGRSMQEKKEWLEREWKIMRHSLMREPRGYNDMEGAVLTEPVSQEADIGIIFMSPAACWDMCGTVTIGVVTTLIELGVIEAKGDNENVNVKFDTPAGLVSATAKVREGKVKEVSLINVPSFYYRTFSVPLPGKGNVEVDIAYGGEFLAIVKAEKLGLALKKQNKDELVKLSLKIMEVIKESQKIVHPSGREGLVDLVRVIEEQGNIAKSVTIPPEGVICRSPCGTGTSAHMALKYAKGEISLGEEVIHRGIIGTEFRSRLIDKKNLWGIETVVPEITGSAWITGISEFIIDPDDPLREGFEL